ncbi:hypothetical protein BJV77DRAFT_306868 [Russula vinacea]|nr:hypothetical protein BJV77DRAFT_306868 [Russula vinacea]
MPRRIQYGTPSVRMDHGFMASSGEKIRHSAERSRLPSDTASKKCSMLLRARRIFFFSFSFAFREKTRYYQGCYFRLLFLPFFEFFKFTPKDVAPSGKNNAAHKWTFYKAQYFCIVRPKRTVRFFLIIDYSPLPYKGQCAVPWNYCTGSGAVRFALDEVVKPTSET